MQKIIHNQNKNLRNVNVYKFELTEKKFLLIYDSTSKHFRGIVLNRNSTIHLISIL
jgi:hypothetical protein